MGKCMKNAWNVRAQQIDQNKGGLMQTDLSKVNIERLRQLMNEAGGGRIKGLGSFSDERIHDWISTLDETMWFLEEELQHRIRQKTAYYE